MVAPYTLVANRRGDCPECAAKIEELGSTSEWLQVVYVKCPFCEKTHMHGFPRTVPPTPYIERRCYAESEAGRTYCVLGPIPGYDKGDWRKQ